MMVFPLEWAKRYAFVVLQLGPRGLRRRMRVLRFNLIILTIKVLLEFLESFLSKVWIRQIIKLVEWVHRAYVVLEPRTGASL